ncbi:uncharacterized protein CC84DRAFT_1172754 [Paraphaeosphaeria sporulosa]|uniref:Uncharacterized protein n=1 Tax=Paraphaeosphaeria sporulosa TaxID=1460663 RepID=A0A177CS22_9PLEO|nr:uncharacterized protein CC84DRAFT_1172754 [Paraphaeosphaeria sporulosa]OAG10325.1 hypothetical protein CC84DRAFT_1172754 [Paraphaeosphaeria sporulosa]
MPAVFVCPRLAMNPCTALAIDANIRALNIGPFLSSSSVPAAHGIPHTDSRKQARCRHLPTLSLTTWDPGHTVELSLEHTNLCAADHTIYPPPLTWPAVLGSYATAGMYFTYTNAKMTRPVCGDPSREG